MKRVLSTVLLALAISGCDSSGPWDGPAGTRMGVSADQLSKHVVLSKEGETNPLGQSLYYSAQAPKNTDAADKYAYLIGSKSGLCQVSEWIQAMSTENSGIAKALVDKYGKPDADPKKPMQLIWSSEKYKLDNELQSIRVRFSGEPSAASAMITYSYKNLSECS